jgi:hypothetical protein
MNNKVRLDTKIEVNGFYFPSMPGLVFHSGIFWLNNNKVKYVYNNGSKAILIAGTKRGLTKFRKEALPCVVTIYNNLPF